MVEQVLIEGLVPAQLFSSVGEEQRTNGFIEESFLSFNSFACGCLCAITLFYLSLKKSESRVMLYMGCDMLFYEAVHTHPANMCPLLTPEGKAMVRQLFSEENVEKADIKIAAAYLSCPKDQASDHKGFSTIETDSEEKVKKFFGPMTVEVRPVQPLSELAKTL